MPPLTFQPLARTDFPLLARWLDEPHVKRWWCHDTSPQAIEADFGTCADDTEPTVVVIANAGGRPVGLVQWYRFDAYPQYLDELAPLLAVPGASLSMDYFVGEPDLLRQGWGAAMLREALRRIWADHPDAPSVVVPVHASNVGSWRVLERAGLRRVARGPLAPDNPSDDTDHLVYAIDRPGRT